MLCIINNKCIVITRVRCVEELSRVNIEEVATLPAKSSPVDFMLKSNVDIVAPLITRLANMSFCAGVFQSSLKQGRVTPLLKKPGDGELQTDHKLSTMSKVLKKPALRRLRPHCDVDWKF